MKTKYYPDFVDFIREHGKKTYDQGINGNGMSEPHTIHELRYNDVLSTVTSGSHDVTTRISNLTEKDIYIHISMDEDRQFLNKNVNELFKKLKKETMTEQVTATGTTEQQLEKRLYFLVPYNISPIQQAIQAGHAALEYAHLHGDDPEYVDFIENWKTWIILNGGTTNNNRDENMITLGSLNQIADGFMAKFVKHSTFYEPDLNNALTAICLLVDERIFNTKDYPDFDQWVFNKGHSISGTDRDGLYEMFVEEVGKEVAYLKEVLNPMRLA
jgi:hypothetical protein